MKPSAKKARALADSLGLPFLSLEDGFVRSVGVGQGEPTSSIVVDDLGIYYDARHDSRFERLVLGSLDSDETDRAKKLIALWQSSKVSKFNYARPYRGGLPDRYVLLVDQTFGDSSIVCGLASPESFSRMLEAALCENPGIRIIVKVHPEVMLGRKRGHFDIEKISSHPSVTVIGEDVHPATLIAGADSIYTVTSQVGFEGLLWGKRVRTFGMPFYAGWGLTVDELAAPARRTLVPLENLVHAALITYPRYVDRETGEACQAERVIEWLGLQRRMRERFPDQLFAVGFSDWKKPVVRDFFQGSEVQFVNRLQSVPTGGAVIGWGLKSLEPPKRWFEFGVSPTKEKLSAHQVIRLEDGFLRSVGLGADLVRPLSWVMDSTGIYYDSTRSSDLERILLQEPFDAALLSRAANLRKAIVASRVTKYNVGSGGWRRPKDARRVILVPGQVESDASIAFGAPVGQCKVNRNMSLLQSVREANPDALVVYKPHPDVLAGLRVKGEDEGLATQWCDEVVVDVPMGEMLDMVDEVHVITSLAGFEALLRGKLVTCYGQPFYSGWGLTSDVAPVSRRTRKLSIDALVAGCLILYPTYVSRVTGRFTTPERALQELLAWRLEGASSLPFWRRALRFILRFYKR